jgi:ribosome-binding protein aMBF1 (putative translation factor)
MGGRMGFPILGNAFALNIPSSVNAKNKSYQKAYLRFRVRLVQAREEAGLTQSEVASRLGKAHSFISKCELGERRVDFIELQQLARIYKKELSFFRE